MELPALGNLVVGMGWLAFEVVLAVRRRASSAEGARSEDRRSLRVLWGTIAVALTVGITLGVRGVGRVPAAWPAAAFVGQALVLVGLALRVAAIRVLARFFTVDVAIHEGHRVVQEGPYAWVRHPAYLGNILAFAGVGLTFASWAAFVAIFPPVVAAFVVRMRIEERALLEALGPAYADYCGRTARLVPGVY